MFVGSRPVLILSTRMGDTLIECPTFQAPDGARGDRVLSPVPGTQKVNKSHP